MASTTPHTHLAEVSVAAASGSAASIRSASAEAPATAASTAQEAVEAIARIADAQTSRADSGAHTVNLAFKFGDAQLSVRVEMSGGEVRTQFHTDSADLRDALSAQWSALSSSSADRAYHFAAPVFSSGGPSSDLSSFSQGRSPSQGTAPESFLTSRSSLLAASGEDPTAAEDAASSVGSTVSTAGHLHAFA